MGEALITRRGNNRDNYKTRSNSVVRDGSNNDIKWIYNLDFGKYDYIVHIVSRNSATGVHGDTYEFEDGVITKEYHTDGEPHVTLTINKNEGSIKIFEKYSNGSVVPAGCLVVALF